MTGYLSHLEPAATRPARASTRAAAPDSVEAGRWDDDGGNPEHDEDACRRARRLLARGSPIHAVTDRLHRWQHEIFGRRWLRRTVVASAALLVAGCVVFALLWWRLGAGPIGINMATPWLAQAIEENFGNQHRVEVGGTQIERAEGGHIAVRILDIVVRDRDNVIVANAPKAEVRLSGAGLFAGRLRAESLNLVGAVLSVRLAADGRVTVSAGSNARPIATSAPGNPTGPAPSVSGAPASNAPTGRERVAGRADAGPLRRAGMARRAQRLGTRRLRPQRDRPQDGTLTVDDQQSGSKWTFENITLSLRRPSGGGVLLQVGEEHPEKPWTLRASIGPPRRRRARPRVSASNVSTQNILLALRMNDMSYTADIPISGRIRGEIGRDGFPTFLSGKVIADAGEILDRKVPDYPMRIDRAEFNVEWDASRRTMLAPFQVVSGPNSITLLAHLEPPNDQVPHWQFGLSAASAWHDRAQG